MIGKRKRQQPRIVVIGGGTGSFSVLSGLKHVTPHITALVSMVDDGGSTGQLRDEYGVLPPGDVRQCLVALSNSSQEMRDLFNFRFGGGSLDGHSFGNIFLAAVEKMSNDFAGAVMLAEEVLNITGRVLPITLHNTQLVLQCGNVEIVGQRAIESAITQTSIKPVLSLRPNAVINPEAHEAIMSADMIVLAPGSFYESLVASLIVDGVGEAMRKTKARVVQIVNLVTKPGQTDGWSVTDYANEFAELLGPKTVDTVLYNTAKPTKHMLEQYAKDNEFPVTYDAKLLKKATYQSIGAPILSTEKIAVDPHDKLSIKRSFIRHDPDKTAKALMRIYFS